MKIFPPVIGSSTRRLGVPSGDQSRTHVGSVGVEHLKKKCLVRTTNVDLYYQQAVILVQDCAFLCFVLLFLDLKMFKKPAICSHRCLSKGSGLVSSRFLHVMIFDFLRSCITTSLK